MTITPDTPEHLEEMRRLWDEIDEADGDLTTWEADFHESVGRILNSKNDLFPSGKQEAALRRIHRKVCG